MSDALIARDLSSTVDNVHAAFLEGRKVSRAHREAAGHWLAQRHGLAGAYANTFALSAAEKKRGIRVYSGERMTHASARHIAGEETCVALLPLDGRTKKAADAVIRATARPPERPPDRAQPKSRTGVF